MVNKSVGQPKKLRKFDNAADITDFLCRMLHLHLDSKIRIIKCKNPYNIAYVFARPTD